MPQVRASVCLLEAFCEHALRVCADLLQDLDSGDVMAWRRSGHDWCDIESALGSGSSQDDLVSATEIADANMRDIQCAPNQHLSFCDVVRLGMLFAGTGVQVNMMKLCALNEV